MYYVVTATLGERTGDMELAMLDPPDLLRLDRGV
jgi:hypothetical protein